MIHMPALGLNFLFLVYCPSHLFSLSMGKHLIHAVLFVYALQWLTGKMIILIIIVASSVAIVQWHITTYISNMTFSIVFC